MVALLFIVFMVLDGLFVDFKAEIFFTGYLLINRSPVLVAMALREAGMNRQESIDFVRARRRGSFNVRQLRIPSELSFRSSSRR